MRAASLLVACSWSCATPSASQPREVTEPATNPTPAFVPCTGEVGAWVGAFSADDACEAARIFEERTDGGATVTLVVEKLDGAAVVRHVLASGDGPGGAQRYRIAGTVPTPGPRLLVAVIEDKQDDGARSQSLSLLQCSPSACRSLSTQSAQRIVVDVTRPSELDYRAIDGGDGGTTDEKRYRLVFHDGRVVRTPR